MIKAFLDHGVREKRVSVPDMGIDLDRWDNG
jgi:hypothetical protein